VGVAVVVVTPRLEVIVPFAAGVTEAGDKLHDMVALVGEIVQVNPTAALKLFTDVTVIVELVVFPTVVVAEAGVAVMLKSGAAPTFKL
jgi:hypothetical protein